MFKSESLHVLMQFLSQVISFRGVIEWVIVGWGDLKEATLMLSKTQTIIIPFSARIPSFFLTVRM